MSCSRISREREGDAQRTRLRGATILRSIEIEDDEDGLDLDFNEPGDDEDPDEANAASNDDLIDLTLGDEPKTQPDQIILTIFHNGALTKKAARIKSAPLFWNGRQLRPHMSVELNPDPEGISDFLTIKSTMRDEIGQRFLRGLRSRRCSHLPFFPDEPNAVCLMLDRSSSKLEDVFEQGLIDVPLEAVKQIREMRFTSEPFIYTPGNAVHPINASNPVLINRYMYVAVDVSHTKLPKPSRPADPLEPTIGRKLPAEGLLRRLLAMEIAHDGRTVQGTAGNHTPSNIKSRAYIRYGSLCCGCGGDCAGARMVDGYRVVFAADRDRAAVTTFSHNFPYVNALKKNLLYRTRAPVTRIDHLHCSWPCQFWSGAHTRLGKNDDYNRAILTANYAKLEEFDPIYHTMENTSGLLTNHPAYCAMALSDILRAGYQVRWKICQFKDYGLPASRNRLIIFAAKDGYSLPDFPKPTHGPGLGLLPYSTINEAIANIPADATLHHDFIRPYDKRRPRCDGNTQAKCIMAGSGDGAYHPSGGRPYTPRELARLQQFPDDYEFFCKKDIELSLTGQGIGDYQRQIGNAVPPRVWAQFCAAILRCHTNFRLGIINARGDRVVQDAQPSTPTRRRRSASPRSRESARSERRTRMEAFDDAPVRSFSRLTIDLEVTPAGNPTRRKQFDCRSNQGSQIVDLTGDSRVPQRSNSTPSRRKYAEIIDLDSD